MQARSENSVDLPTPLGGLSTRAHVHPWERVEDTCPLHLCLGVQREAFLFGALPPQLYLLWGRTSVRGVGFRPSSALPAERVTGDQLWLAQFPWNLGASISSSVYKLKIMHILYRHLKVKSCDGCDKVWPRGDSKSPLKELEPLWTPHWIRCLGNTSSLIDALSLKIKKEEVIKCYAEFPVL